MGNEDQQQKRPPVRHVDRPEIAETFADSLHRIQWDGQTLRIEFCVTRLPDPGSPAGTAASRYTACRLVLPAQATVDLFNGLQQTMAALEQAGLVGQQSASASPPGKAS